MTAWLVLDVHCRPCDRPGAERVPRLARFVRAAAGGSIGTQKFKVNGQDVVPKFWHRPSANGLRTWHLKCRCGHDIKLHEEAIAAAIAAIQPDPDGNGSARVSL